jgi:hypothetical protein
MNEKEILKSQASLNDKRYSSLIFRYLMKINKSLPDTTIFDV